MTAAAGLLPGNLFSVADSDFESALTGNWAATTNCTLAQSATHAFTGADSLRISATAGGAAVATYAGLPVVAGQGYDFSWYAFATAGSRTARASLVFRNGGGAQVGSTVNQTLYSLANGSWIPAADWFVPPATAVKVDIAITISTPGAGELTYLDLFYCAPALARVLVAWGTTPLSAGPQFADMTPFTRADKGISYGRGRGDEISAVQPGTGSFTLDNGQWPGWFAQGNAGSPFAPAISRRARISFADETGAFHSRFDGTITDLAPSWDDGTGLSSLTQVSAQGLLAWLNRGTTMRTMLEEEIALDAPLCLYTLADPPSATSAATTASDTSGNAAAPLQRHRYGTGASLSFGSGAGIIGALAPGFATSPLQSVLAATNSPIGNIQLEAYLPSPVSAAAGLTFGIWCSLGTNAGALPICLVNSRTGEFIAAEVTTGGVHPVQLAHALSPSSLVTGSTAVVAIPATIQHLMITVSGTTATLYVNGASAATLTVPAGFTADYLIVSGSPGGLSVNTLTGSPGGVSGSLNCAAVFATALSAGRIAAHWSAGSGQNWGSLIAVLAGNVLTYAGIPAAFTSIAGTGVSYADAADLAGQAPLSVLQQYQLADGGVFYENASGQIAFQDRAQRYAAQAVPALVLTPGQYEAPLGLPSSTQFLVNDSTAGNANIPAGVRAISAASVALNGTYPSGAPGSPVTAPFYSFPYTGTSEVIAGAVPDGDVLADAASWQVNIYGTPVPRSPSVTIDLATQPASQFSRATAYAVEIGQVIQLSGLPSSGPGGTRVNFLAVEGITETFTRGDQGVAWTLAFNTSPASQSGAWIPGDAAMGILDSTAVVGRGTDGATIGGYQYAGPPYPVPTFSAGMNETGNVGANDMRGLAANVQQAITPPAAFAQQVSLAQSIPDSTNTDLQWDILQYDTAGGFFLSGDVVAYHVQVPGIYDFMATVVFANNGTGDRRAWLQQNSGGAFGYAKVQSVSSGQTTALLVAATIACALGDKIKVTCFQTSGGSLAIGTSNGGAQFSARFRGQ